MDNIWSNIMSLFIINLLGTVITNDNINKTLMQDSEHIM